ncbi:MAG: tripartite tricarboxylate transporter substrate binding protein [Xanthobacteraceae bacterium]
MAIPRRQFLHLAASAAGLFPLTRVAMAQDAYPSHPIRLIVGFTPGAASDIAARLFAKGASDILGQPVVVENKPGAAGSIAGQYVTHAANDGYTLLLFALSTLTNEILNPTPSFDVSKDLAPIGLLATGSIVLAVNPASNVRSVAELVALAKSKPGGVLYGSTGVGSIPQLAAEMFAQRTGVKLTHVPYPGSPQITGDLLAGHITMSFNIASGVIGQIEAGQLLGLAVAANKRSSALPNVPTMAEAGIPDFDTSLWLGLAAPAGTPRPIIEKLADAARQAMHSPDALEILRKQGYEANDADPDKYGAFIHSELERWSGVIRAAGLKS